MSADAILLHPFNPLDNMNPKQKPLVFSPSKKRLLPPIPAFPEEKFCQDVIRKKIKLNSPTESMEIESKNDKKIMPFNLKSGKETVDLTSKMVPENLGNIFKKLVFNKKKNEFEIQVANEYLSLINRELEKVYSSKKKMIPSPEKFSDEESKIQKEEPQSPVNKIIKEEAKPNSLMSLEAKEKLKNIHKILGYRLLKDMFDEKTKWAYQNTFIEEMENYLFSRNQKVKDFREWLDRTWLTFRYKDGHEEKRCILQARRDFIFLIEYSERKEKLLQSLLKAPKLASAAQIENLERDVVFGRALRDFALIWLEKYAPCFLSEKSNRLTDGALYLEKIPEITKLFKDYLSKLPASN